MVPKSAWPALGHLFAVLLAGCGPAEDGGAAEEPSGTPGARAAFTFTPAAGTEGNCAVIGPIRVPVGTDVDCDPTAAACANGTRQEVTNGKDGAEVTCHFAHEGSDFTLAADISMPEFQFTVAQDPTSSRLDVWDGVSGARVRSDSCELRMNDGTATSLWLTYECAAFADPKANDAPRCGAFGSFTFEGCDSSPPP